jgi:amino acid transporter
MSAVQHNSKKLSLAQFIWLGFNYTVGIGFIGNLAILSNYVTMTTDESGAPHFYMNTDSVGMHIIWIFVLLGIVASISAFAFAKLAKVHKSDNNGGAYLYTRTAMGRFMGFFTTFMQYIVLPFLITSQIFNLLKAFFEGTYAGATGLALDTALGKNSHWASLILDVCGILIYFFFAFVVFGGMKLFKRLSSATGVIKWVTSAFLIVGAIYLATTSTSTGHTASDNLKNWFDPSWTSSSSSNIENASGFHLTFGAFTKAFTSCFFFYAGFETFATAGKNIENPEKNMGLGILIIMLISTVFYVLTIIVFVSGIDPMPNATARTGGLIQNMNMGLWTYEGFKNGDSLTWVAYGGMAIMIVSQLALKANVSMQNALYGGTMVQPLAQEGYISERYNELNKDDLPIKGSILNFIITAAVLCVWLIIPDLYEGITGADPVFSVSQLTEASSAITLFIYAMVILSVAIHGFKKRLKVHGVEWAMFGLVFVLFVAMFFYHYATLFINLKGFGSKTGSEEFSAAIGAFVELIFVLVSAGFAVIWYFAYYKKILKKRMASPEGVAKQKDLDSEFVLVNQTAFISILFGRNGTSKRNSAIDVFEKELQNHERLEELKRKIKYEQHTYLAKNTITTAQDKEKYDALVKANREKIKALKLDVREKDQQIKAEAKKTPAQVE